MKLAAGALAPDFTASDWQGKPVKLSDVKGRRWLAFFRYAGCPLCNLRVHAIGKRHAQLAAKGLSVLAVFQSPAAHIAGAVADRAAGGQGQPGFPLLADPDETLYRLYGLEASLWGFLSPANWGRTAQAFAKGICPGKQHGTTTRIPADFLIDADGKIAQAYYGKVIADHIPFADVERFAG